MRFETLENRRMLSVAGGVDADADAAIQLFSTSTALFVENQGQWADESLHYRFNGDGVNIAFTDEGLSFLLTEREKVEEQAETSDPFDHLANDHFDNPDDYITHSTQFSVSFDDANTVTPIGLDAGESRFNYFVGDQANWAKDVPGYETVAYEELYDGIDLHMFGRRDSLKYEFYVAPGADYHQIKVSYEGVEGLWIDDVGALHVDTTLGQLVDDSPYIYQVIDGQQIEVSGQFRLVDLDTYTFDITGEYDPSVELVVDPNLDWTVDFGIGSENSNDLYVDEMGNLLVTGIAWGPGWVMGGPDESFGGYSDAFAAKFSPNGEHLWSTFIGGTGTDVGSAIAADSEGNVIFVGTAYFDSFVSKLTTDGDLLWTQRRGHYGLGYTDFGSGLAIDQNDNIILTGFLTDRATWVSGGWDTSYSGGGRDGFVLKMAPDGTNIWATYLGGSGEDFGHRVQVDAYGNVYVIGGTSSSDWQLFGWDNQYDGSTSHNGYLFGPTAERFLVKLSSDGAHLWSTFLGGISDRNAFDLAVDTANNVVVVGQKAGDAEVVKFSPSGEHLWSSYLGGGRYDNGAGIAIDGHHNILVTGTTQSYGWVSGGWDDYHDFNGFNDVFVARLSPDGNHQWSSYLRGGDEEYSRGIALDNSGGAIVLYDTNFGLGVEYQYLARIGDAAIVDTGDSLYTARDFGNLNDGVIVSRTTMIGDGPYGNKDVDLYEFQLTQASDVDILITTYEGQLPDPPGILESYLRLFDSNGNLLASNDDFSEDIGASNVRLGSRITKSLSAGRYYAGVSGYPNTQYSPHVAGSGVPAVLTGPYTLEIDVHGGQVPSVSADHLTFELLAREVAYDVSLSKSDSALIEDYIVDEIFTGSFGFDAVGLVSPSGLPPVLAIRGTEPTSDVWDVLDDTNPNGIGWDQFQLNKSSVEAWLRSNNESVIVGHSLGGALAQWIAADYTSQSDNGVLGEIVTFNSPGISKDYAAAFIPEETAGVTHYIQSGDIVSLAGDDFIEGTATVFTYVESDLLPWKYLANKHLRPMLVPSIQHSDGQLTQPSDLSSQVIDVDWLNSSMFGYTDPQHLIFVAAAETVALPFPALAQYPSRLLFRGTTEATRSAIGSTIDAIIDHIVFDLDLNSISVRLPDTTLNLPGSLSLTVDGLIATFTTSPQQSLKIQGTASMEPFGIVANFSGGNYIQLSDSGLDVVGEITIGGPITVGPGYSLENIWASFDTPTNSYQGGATLNIPSGPVTVDLAVQDGYFHSISIDTEDLGYTIVSAYGLPVVVLQDIVVDVDEMSPGPPPFTLLGALGFTGGPQIQFDGNDYYLLRLDLDTTFNAAGRISGNAEVFLGGGDDPLEISSAKVIIDKNYGVWVAGHLHYGSFFTMDVYPTLRLGLDRSMTGSIKGTFAAPSWLFEGPSVTAKGIVQYSDDSDDSNDLLIIGGQILGKDRAFSLNLNTGAIDWTANYAKIDEFDVVPPPPGAAALSAPHSVSIPAGLTSAIFQVEWETADTHLELTNPAGTITYKWDNVGGHPDVAYYKDPTGKIAFFEVDNPAGGDWTATVTETDGIGTYTIATRQSTVAPTITLLSPEFDTPSDPVGISWLDEDTDSDDALINLYYDTDSSGADGTLIVAGINEDDPVDSYSWDTTGVETGDYYVYAMIDDGTNVPVVSYATGRVSIVHADAPAVVTGLNAPEGTATSVHLTWDASAAPGLDHYLVRMTANAAGESYQQTVTASDAETTINGLVAGENYRATVVAVDSDGHVSEASNPIVIQLPEEVFASTDVPVSIPDNTTVFSSLNVSGLTGRLIDVNVSLEITHTYDSDLDVYLVSPNGTRVELFTDVGSSGNNFIGTILDDEATTSIHTGSAPFTGNYQPEGVLADFDGELANGLWRIEVTDDASADPGSLIAWSLILTTLPINEWVVAAKPGKLYTAIIVGAQGDVFTDITLPDGKTPLATIDVNQELVPSDFTEDGVGWKNLGTFTITGSTLTVQLTDDADEYVIADAIRIDKVVNGIPASDPQIIDNGDLGFNTVGTWPAYFGKGYQGDLHYASQGIGASQASWTFNVAPGEYEVSATWYNSSNRATDAPYTIFDGTSLTPDMVDSALFEWDVPVDADGWSEVLVHATHTDGTKSVYRYYLFADSSAPHWTPGSLHATVMSSINIELVAPTGIDPSGVLHYQLERDGAVAGIWQTSPLFVDSGLSSNTEYDYRVQTRDSSPDNLFSSWTTLVSAYTLAETPSAPVLGALTDTSVVLAGLGTDNNPATTEYSIRHNNTSMFVDVDGTLSASPVWQVAADWTNATIVSLASYIEHSFVVVARNADSVETAASPAASLWTLRETIPPTVNSFKYDQARGIVEIAFSEPVAITLKDISLEDSSSADVDLSGVPFTYTPTGNLATLDLSGIVAAGQHTLTLDGNAVQDLSSNLLGSNYVKPLTLVSADFDADGDVDGSDFLAWQRGYGIGTTLTEGDANNSGTVDGDDLAVWESQFGTISAPVTAAVTASTAPIVASGSQEPQTVALTSKPLSADLVDAAMAVGLASRSITESLSVYSAPLRDDQFDWISHSMRWDQQPARQGSSVISSSTSRSQTNKDNDSRFNRNADDDAVNEELLDELFADGEFHSLL